MPITRGAGRPVFRSRSSTLPTANSGSPSSAHAAASIATSPAATAGVKCSGAAGPGLGSAPAPVMAANCATSSAAAWLACTAGGSPVGMYAARSPVSPAPPATAAPADEVGAIEGGGGTAAAWGGGSLVAAVAAVSAAGQWRAIRSKRSASIGSERICSMLGRAVGSFCRMCRTSDRTASLAVSVAARAASPPVWTGEEAGVGEGGNGVYRACEMA
mmetsp:Transcript_36654/g.118219  ORF Transcript_36654/g.118219 Transcript_36654/m.118219 type:complete len:216 (-) Transcript_36654:819-1466(-)